MAVAALALLGGCATRGGPIPYENPSFGAPDVPSPDEVAYDWPLGPLDVVRVSVFQVPELSGEYQVDADGFLDLPLVGRMNVSNQKPEQLARSLEQTYGRNHLSAPDIKVRLVSTQSQTATVDGGVRQPQMIPLRGKTTLLSAITLAGGLADGANPKRVAIIRQREGQTVAAAFDLISIRRGEMDNPLVYPGDTVVVATNDLRGIYRDLLQTLPVIAIFGPL